jgi:hypothetical protein
MKIVGRGFNTAMNNRDYRLVITSMVVVGLAMFAWAVILSASVDVNEVILVRVILLNFMCFLISILYPVYRHTQRTGVKIWSFIELVAVVLVIALILLDGVLNGGISHAVMGGNRYSVSSIDAFVNVCSLGLLFIALALKLSNYQKQTGTSGIQGSGSDGSGSDGSGSDGSGSDGSGSGDSRSGGSRSGGSRSGILVGAFLVLQRFRNQSS